MALLKYFAPSKNLPDPNSPLSKTVPATAVVAANMEVSKVTVSSEPMPTTSSHLNLRLIELLNKILFKGYPYTEINENMEECLHLCKN